jgi:hypothetical protein
VIAACVTGPQTPPEPNAAHWNKPEFVPVEIGDSEIGSAELKMRKPTLPVSSRILSTVAHDVGEFGTHIVTVT